MSFHPLKEVPGGEQVGFVESRGHGLRAAKASLPVFRNVTLPTVSLSSVKGAKPTWSLLASELFSQLHSQRPHAGCRAGNARCPCGDRPVRWRAGTWPLQKCPAESSCQVGEREYGGSELTVGALCSVPNTRHALRSWRETGHLACGPRAVGSGRFCSVARRERQGGQASFLTHRGRPRTYRTQSRHCVAFQEPLLVMWG